MTEEQQLLYKAAFRAREVAKEKQIHGGLSNDTWEPRTLHALATVLDAARTHGNRPSAVQMARDFLDEWGERREEPI